MSFLIFRYRRPALRETKKKVLINKASVIYPIDDIDSEFCFYIEVSGPLKDKEIESLRWLLSETFEPDNFGEVSFLGDEDILEVGPRLNFTTPWSTNAVSVFSSCGLDKVKRIERSRRFSFIVKEKTIVKNLHKSLLTTHSSLFYDRMTEMPYKERLQSFDSGIKPEPVYEVRIIEEGITALERINRELGLGLDEWDINYYYNIFLNEIKRNPTNVECFDLGQSNSEHSRHWFFKGELIIDGIRIPETLMDIIKRPYLENPNNSVIAFRDNSSAIRGYRVRTIIPDRPGYPSRFVEKNLLYHIIFTAETHNFPSGVAPFPGAETGTGGRIRDIQAVGRGGLVVAGTAAYCVGNLRIPGYVLPWEDETFEYPGNLATPLQIEIEASNGASDYGNKFGEPVIQGFTRSFGMRLPDGERREWIKPIMFTGGIGQMDSRHTEKGSPEKGMLVVKVGGPAYRIGIGGGAASSVLAGELPEELDFNAVQRGDAEMEQKMNRVIRACIEMGDENPIISIHDQGAGGNCNVLKELVYPSGAMINVRKIPLGDETLSVLEIWGAEYQESNALLIRPEKISLFEAFCKREKVPYATVGEVTGDGRIVLYDDRDGSTPVNLDLKKVLGEMPQKRFNMERIKPKRVPLILEGITIKDALEKVLRLVSVGSKRFLTNKVDRSVTGLIARQQCCGPLHLTVSDVAVIAQSHFGFTGAAIAIGEQPIKGLINPASMARMAVAEALTNIVWALISDIEDIKVSANWMWAAKLPGEGAALYDAAVAMSEILSEIGIAVDGGKDSLSMAAIVKKKDGSTETVKAPGSLVISAYVTCPDIRKVITPDIKRPGKSKLLLIDLSPWRKRLGGSALAHVFNQIGDESPDIDDPFMLKRAFMAVQELIKRDLILSGHDVSDGGLITTVLEMAFSGDCGLNLKFPTEGDTFSLLFSEEASLVFEYDANDEKEILRILRDYILHYKILGSTMEEKRIKVEVNGKPILDEDMTYLRSIWEETSYQIERLQVDPDCADEERKNIYAMKRPPYKLTFTPQETPEILKKGSRPKVAIIREEGSNGDREMTSAFYEAGFDTWDIMMTDIIEGRIGLDDFRGIAFVGGFSYADVLDSAKGWAGVIRFNKRAFEEFQRFYERDETFSLGVCNGCQLMALLGWIPWHGIGDERQPRFIHNRSGRFESRFSTVKILKSPSIFLKGMEDSILGIWVAHGEGRVHFPDKSIMKDVLNMGLAPVRYVDDSGEVTESYPFNPNGSPEGIAALCSPDGRHLAIMPHPERTFLKWQWPWMPEDWKGIDASPWLRIFQNARRWCEET
ncbi:MAG: phosphoribosylformylglycinamidine synthase [Thermodesulfovibrionales bacterium]